MAVPVRLLDLPRMHPLLLWDPIIPAAYVVFRGRGVEPPFRFLLAVEGVPGFGTESLELQIDPTGIPAELVGRCERTFEASRRIEFAAIAVTALGLNVAGAHEMIDVARRGSAADYLVDAARHHLEIAGRSRRRDLDAAWEQKEPRFLEDAIRHIVDNMAEREREWRQAIR